MGGEMADLDWIMVALSFANAERILSFGSMMLLAQALEALWDPSIESIQNYKHARKG